MRDLTTEERGYLWLSLVDTMPIDKKYALLEAVGGINELYLDFVSHTDTVIEIAGKTLFAKLNHAIMSDVIDEEIDKLDKAGADIVTIDNNLYPDLLRQIDGAPLLLYYMGDMRALNVANTLSVVGTRTPSRYGKDATKSLVRDLVRSGMTTISGLARGVDTIVHKTTLEEDGITVAVVANGIDSCYPAENHELKERIIDTGGVVMTEYPIGSIPHAYRFPERNRIISGLSHGTLVTEAGRHSGSLITLGSAIDQGRNVYIVPGQINTPTCQGSNDAIKSLQGAMVTTAEDILKDYDLVKAESKDEEIELSDIEKRLVEFIKVQDRHIDELIALVDMNVNSLLALLAKLELYGLIQRLPGNYYGK